MGCLRIAALSTLLVISAVLGFAQPHNFSTIDNMVQGISQTNNLQEVIQIIKAKSQNDWERARGAYDWVANNINYDVDSFFRGTPTKTDAEGVFETRKSVCEGYANLFAKIAEGLGLQVQVISGYSKAFGYTQGKHFSACDHAWNAVKLDGTWHFIESTWGSGYLDNLKFTKHYSSLWFDMDPRLFVFNHFPSDTNWLLLSESMTLNDYEKAPLFETYQLERLVEAGFSIDSILEISKHLPLGKSFGQDAQAFIKMGGDPEDMISYLVQNSVPSAQVYDDHKIQLVDYPREGLLKVGNTYRFAVNAPGCDKVAVIHGTNFSFLFKNGNLFSGDVTITPGETCLSANINSKDKMSYWPIMIWQTK